MKIATENILYIHKQDLKIPKGVKLFVGELPISIAIIDKAITKEQFRESEIYPVVRNLLGYNNRLIIYKNKTRTK